MTKNHKPTHLVCSYHTAGLIFLALGALFAIVGCAALYKMIGLTEKQTATQVAQDQDATEKIIEQMRWTTHEIITTTLAGAGTILSGLLARWLGTERTITKTLITNIEKHNSTDLKEAITTTAKVANIEPQLHNRVRALT